MADRGHQIRRGGGGHSDPEIRWGPGLKKIFFQPFGPQFRLKIRQWGSWGGGGRSPGPLPWIRHCKVEGELRAILRLSMRIYNAELKLARFIHITLRENVLNSRQLPEYFGILAAA